MKISKKKKCNGGKVVTYINDDWPDDTNNVADSV